MNKISTAGLAVLLFGCGVGALSTQVTDRTFAPGPTQLTSPSASPPLPLEQPLVPSLQTRPLVGSADTFNLPPRFGISGNLGGLRDMLWEHGVLL